MEIHKQIKSFYKNIKLHNIDTGLSSLCYFSSVSSTLGYHKMFLWKKGKGHLLKYIFMNLKYLFSISSQSNYILENNCFNEKYKNIVVTWAYKKHFLKNGSLQDRYFNLNSRKNSNIFWIVFYLDDESPEKIDENIVLFRKKKLFFSYNFIYLFKIILKNIYKNKFNFKKIHHNLSSSSNVALIFTDLIKKNFNLRLIKSLTLSYEGQPFQQYLFSYLKKEYPYMKTIGYLSYAYPMQLNIFYRNGAPDELLTHSPDQKIYIIKNLGWPKNRVKLIRSLRYKNIKDKKLLINKVFFPYYFNSIKKISENFELFIKSAKPKSLPIFKIKQHPAPYSKSQQLKLERNLKKIMNQNKEKFKKNIDNRAIIIGLTTSVLVTLEKGIEVIHIVTDHFFESFDNKYWPNIKVKRFFPNVLSYKLKKYGRCIKFGNNKESLLKFI